ncbi:hypothetical protein [Streptomyces sp. x-19]|uniref:hypothetical protein n=1 Tax=Streptomyces sp. x-19 TaxID=2789280 RepID=UPI0039806A9A
MTTPTPLLPITLTTQPARHTPPPSDTPPARHRINFTIGTPTSTLPMTQPVHCEDITLCLPTGIAPTDLLAPQAAPHITAVLPYPGNDVPGYSWTARITRTPHQTLITFRPEDPRPAITAEHPLILGIQNIPPHPTPGTTTITITETTTPTPNTTSTPKQTRITLDKEILTSQQHPTTHQDTP